jgi:hypothetical protein
MNRLACAVLAGTFLAIVTLTHASRLPSFAQSVSSPRVAIVRADANVALVYWDATQTIVQVVKKKLPPGAANARLERGGLQALAAVYAQLTGSKVITVEVTYNETADENPAYGVFTFAGLEKYADLTISARDAESDKGKWREVGATGKIPSCVTFKVIGHLPSR